MFHRRRGDRAGSLQPGRPSRAKTKSKAPAAGHSRRTTCGLRLRKQMSTINTPALRPDPTLKRYRAAIRCHLPPQLRSKWRLAQRLSAPTTNNCSSCSTRPGPHTRTYRSSACRLSTALKAPGTWGCHRQRARRALTHVGVYGTSASFQVWEKQASRQGEKAWAERQGIG